jgi:hypothetical protein
MAPMMEGAMSKQAQRSELLRAIREEGLHRNEALRKEFYDWLTEPDTQGVMALKPNVTIEALAYTVDAFSAMYRLDRQALEEELRAQQKPLLREVHERR